MRNLEQITTHEADGFDRLKQDFKDKGNFKDLIGVLTARTQAFEDIAFPMIQSMYIANATGSTLDSIGENVGRTRPVFGDAATDDDVYRVLIYAQIAANTSVGRISDFYNILGALGLSNTKVYQVFPAALTVNYTPNTLTMTCACIRSILESASHPIELDIVQHSGTPFGFLGDSGAFGFGVGELGESA